MSISVEFELNSMDLHGVNGFIGPGSEWITLVKTYCAGPVTTMQFRAHRFDAEIIHFSVQLNAATDRQQGRVKSPKKSLVCWANTAFPYHFLFIPANYKKYIREPKLNFSLKRIVL